MITIDYFSDALCVWAYGGQIRLDELQRLFADQIRVRQRFTPLFADTQTRIGQAWSEKGGFEGFATHMEEVCAQWDHARLHPEVWRGCRPTSCVPAHAFLRAVGLCLGIDDDDSQPASADASAILDGLAAQTRVAFFEQGRDISNLAVLLELLAGTGVDDRSVRMKFESGEAYAALHRDQELMKTYGVQGSPTYVFNEGRQLLYGNVGYRIIESNVRELLSARKVDGEPSWC